MNEIIWQSALVIAVYLMGFFTGQSRAKNMAEAARATGKAEGWIDCEIRLRDRFHFHKKRVKGIK